jgi:hypothetical protein
MNQQELDVLEGGPREEIEDWKTKPILPLRISARSSRSRPDTSTPSKWLPSRTVGHPMMFARTCSCPIRKHHHGDELAGRVTSDTPSARNFDLAHRGPDQVRGPDDRLRSRARWD